MIFMKCERCGNIITTLQSSGIIPQCCGEPMKQLLAGITDGSVEKHVPVIKMIRGTRDGSKARAVIVEIGTAPHPMSPEHYVQWIILETNLGFRVHYLNEYDPPKACFPLAEGEEPVAAYEYCNLHGLWRAEMNPGK